MVWVLVLIGAFSFSMISLGFFVGCFEQISVRQFEPADSPPLAKIHPYLLESTAAAMDEGFVFVADGRHTKFRDNLRAVLMLSPDRSTVLIASAGTIVKLPTKKTILFSRPRSGGLLITVNDIGTCELDPGTCRQILNKATVSELVSEHWLRLETLGGAEPFPADTDWSTVETIYRERADRIVAAGYGTYVDAARAIHRKTVSGSFRASIVHSIRQIFSPKNVARQYGIRSS